MSQYQLVCRMICIITNIFTLLQFSCYHDYMFVTYLRPVVTAGCRLVDSQYFTKIKPIVSQ